MEEGLPHELRLLHPQIDHDHQHHHLPLKCIYSSLSSPSFSSHSSSSPSFSSRNIVMPSTVIIATATFALFLSFPFLSSAASGSSSSLSEPIIPSGSNPGVFDHLPPVSPSRRNSSRKGHSRSSSLASLAASSLQPGSMGTFVDKIPTKTEISMLGPVSGKIPCEVAIGKCTKKSTCGLAYHDYRISCKQELYGDLKNCTDKCQMSIIGLSSTTEGYDTLHCDCETNEYCKMTRKRIEPCSPKKPHMEIIEECKEAETSCKSDPLCQQAFDYYRRHCADMIRGKVKECSRRCNNTVNILWRQRAGQGLRTCLCEKGNTKCNKEKSHVFKYCFHKTYRPHGSGSSSLSPSSVLMSLMTLIIGMMVVGLPTWTCLPSLPQVVFSFMTLGNNG